MIGGPSASADDRGAASAGSTVTEPIAVSGITVGAGAPPLSVRLTRSASRSSAGMTSTTGGAASVSAMSAVSAMSDAAVAAAASSAVADGEPASASGVGVGGGVGFGAGVARLPDPGVAVGRRHR